MQITEDGDRKLSILTELDTRVAKHAFGLENCRSRHADEEPKGLSVLHGVRKFFKRLFVSGCGRNWRVMSEKELIQRLWPETEKPMGEEAWQARSQHVW